MVIIIQNDPIVPPGLFGGYLDALGVAWQCLRVDQGAALPADPTAVILLGGRMGVNDEAQFPFLRALKQRVENWLTSEVPLLGICLGGQLLAQVGGGTFRSASHGEHGIVPLQLSAAGQADPLFAGLPSPLPVFQWHNDSFLPPPQAQALAFSADCPGQAFRLGQAWGVQFHPEVDTAIVECWGANRPGSAAQVADYQRHAATLAGHARQLLSNFLQTAPGLSAPAAPGAMRIA